MGRKPDLYVQIVDDADTTMQVVGDQVLDIGGASDNELVVVRNGELATVTPRISNLNSATNQSFVADTIVDNAGFLAAVPSSTIAAVTRLYTVPAGYWAYFRLTAVNTTGGAVNLSAFLMDDSATTPQAADRCYFASIAANTFVNTGVDTILDEGASVWAFASAAGINAMPLILLIPKDQLGDDTWRMRNIKAVDHLADVQIYPVSATAVAAGRWAQQIATGLIHNTTGGSLTLTTKIQRASDGAAFTVGVQAVSANNQTTFLAGHGPLLAALRAGDKAFVTASGAGLNLWTTWAERPVAA